MSNRMQPGTMEGMDIKTPMRSYPSYRRWADQRGNAQ